MLNRTKRNRRSRLEGSRGQEGGKCTDLPPGRGAICTFQVHTKAKRGGRSKCESFDRINLSVASVHVEYTSPLLDRKRTGEAL